MTKHIKKHTGPLGKLGQTIQHAILPAPKKYDRSYARTHCPICGARLYSVTDGFYCECGWEDLPEPIIDQEIQ